MSDYVDTVHDQGWSAPLNARMDVCEASLPASATLADVDDCLGAYARNADVLAALERYDAAASLLSATLLATDPNGSQAEVIAAWVAMLSAARDLLALLPEGERYTQQLDAIARRVKP